jgi:putative zinc finger protein
MKHLGDRLSALVDGELGHDDRDRMLTHLARCAECRAEATALRALKRRLAALGDTAVDARLVGRLLTLTEHAATGHAATGHAATGHAATGHAATGHAATGHAATGHAATGPAAAAHAAAADPQPASRPRPVPPGYPQTRMPGRRPGGSPGPGRVRAAQRPPRAHRSRRGPYLVASVVMCLVVGIGGASFVAGGPQAVPAPHVIPAVDVFTVQHSVTTGEMSVVSPIAPTAAAKHGRP